VVEQLKNVSGHLLEFQRAQRAIQIGQANLLDAVVGCLETFNDIRHWM
jgi:hypothetical protein